jgi:signal transduction histidine kinase
VLGERVLIIASGQERRDALTRALAEFETQCVDVADLGELAHRGTAAVVDATGLESVWSDIYPVLQEEQLAIIVVCERVSRDLWLYVLEEVVDDLVWLPLDEGELRSRVRTRLNGTARQLVESRARCGRLVAHDLNNPLTVIRMLGEMLKEEVSEDLRPDMESILEATDLASALVEAFASFSKLEGTEEEEYTWLNLDLAEIVREVASRVAFRDRVRLNLPSELATVGDRNALVRAVNDILLNGLKLIRKGSYINIDLRENEESRTLVFSHPGKGIPPEHQHRLLRRYGAEDLRRNRVPVSAVGLAYAAHVAEGHAGTLVLASSTDGLEVLFTVPTSLA